MHLKEKLEFTNVPWFLLMSSNGIEKTTIFTSVIFSLFNFKLQLRFCYVSRLVYTHPRFHQFSPVFSFCKECKTLKETLTDMSLSRSKWLIINQSFIKIIFDNTSDTFEVKTGWPGIPEWKPVMKIMVESHIVKIYLIKSLSTSVTAEIYYLWLRSLHIYYHQNVSKT